MSAPFGAGLQRWAKERADLEAATLILWVNYGTEGWKPEAFTSAEDLRSRIGEGVFEPFLVTGPVLKLDFK